MSKKIREKPGPKTKYQAHFPGLLIEHMAQGLSFESFAAAVHVGRSVLYKWLDTHEEFAEAKEIGFEKSRLFWEKLGIAGVAGKVPNFNAATYIFTLKNRFGYKDAYDANVQGSVDHRHNHEHKVEVEMLMNELKDVIIKPNASENIPLLGLLKKDD